MILDSSVIVAIALREPGHEALVDKLRSADTLGVGTPSLTEAGMVLSSRLGVEPQALLDRFLRDFGVVPVAFGDLHWREALEAFRRFGKGDDGALCATGIPSLYGTQAYPSFRKNVRSVRVRSIRWSAAEVSE